MSAPSYPEFETTSSPRYDRLTISLHWLTALLVVALFAMAIAWDFMPRGTPLRKSLQALHISCGLLLSALIVVRLGWRTTLGRRLPAAERGIKQFVAVGMHYALYLLLVAQAGLGFVFRWLQGESFTFFGLFEVPALMAPDKALAHSVGEIHESVAWAILVLAGLHAAAALMHHFVLKDGVLKRMLSGASA